MKSLAIPALLSLLVPSSALMGQEGSPEDPPLPSSSVGTPASRFILPAVPVLGEAPVIAGNFDPVQFLLNDTPDAVRQACRECHDAFGPRHVVCAGCEVPTNAPIANVQAMFDYARSTTP